MDSVRPILPSKRIRIHGVDRSRDEQIKAASKGLPSMKVLDEQITHSCGEVEIGVRWIDGSHPCLGKVIDGKNGTETIQSFRRFRR